MHILINLTPPDSTILNKIYLNKPQKYNFLSLAMKTCLSAPSPSHFTMLVTEKDDSSSTLLFTDEDYSSSTLLFTFELFSLKAAALGFQRGCELKPHPLHTDYDHSVDAMSSYVP